MTKFYRQLFYGLVAVALLQSGFYYPQLPAVVASHFDGAGAANAWSSRNVFFAIYLAMITLVVGIFAFLPRWSGRRGKLRINIPNRDYWLAPDRLKPTVDYIEQKMLTLGIAHLLLAIYAVQLAIIANLQQQSGLHDSMWWALGAYFIFLSLWLLGLFTHFRKPQGQVG